MKLTTLCYVENANRFLMLHRIRKQQDENEGKWIGIGGHLEENESPEDCIRREAREEAGLELQNLKLRGLLTFILPKWGNELTFVYTASTVQTHLPETDEGVLAWVPKDQIDSLNLWEGDRLFLPLLKEGQGFFSMKLIYDEEDRLTGYRVEQ